MSEPIKTKVWFVTDVKGSPHVFGKIINVVRHHAEVAKRPDVVIVSGSLTGGEICVIGIDENGNPYADFRGERCIFKSTSDRDAWSQIVEDVLGGYIVDGAAGSIITQDRLDSLRRARLLRLMEMATAAQVGSSGARLIIVPGPHDPPDVEAILARTTGIEACDNKLVEINGELSLACSSAIAFPELVETRQMPRHYKESKDDFVRHFRGILDQAAKPRPALVVNFYMPPWMIIDEVPCLDSTGAPMHGPAGPETAHIGSEAVRACIEEFEPVVSLHSFPPLEYRTQRVFKTRAFAPGTEAHTGHASGVWLIFEGGNLKDYYHTREDVPPGELTRFLETTEKAITIWLKRPIDTGVLYKNHHQRRS